MNEKKEERKKERKKKKKKKKKEKKKKKKKKELIERFRKVKALYNLKGKKQCTNTHNDTNQ